VLLIILVFCVVCFVFVCPQRKSKHTTQKTKMISNTDPPQTKTKPTTQKTKMTSKTDTHPPNPWGVCVAYHFSFLCCVFCFSWWGSVLLVILVFCVVCFVFVFGGLGGAVQNSYRDVLVYSMISNTDPPQTKTKHTTQKTKMISNTEPQQTKTKHTTQKTKMIGNTDPPQTKTKHTTQKTKMTSNTDVGVLCCLSF
jgi:hypothetical protein